MTGLFDIWNTLTGLGSGNNNKKKTTKASNNKASTKSTNKEKTGNILPAGTETARKNKAKQKSNKGIDASSGGYDEDGNYIGEGGYYDVDGNYVGSDGGDGSSGSTEVKSSMSEAEIKTLENMKDSNVPYYYDHDENDLMYLAASEEKDYYWGLKEEVFLYTIHDRQKHRYITSFQIDSDAQDITTTCTVEMPYRDILMEYYIPGKTAFMLIGGTFDREVLFIGRVSEVNQLGDSIQVVGQNLGWKFKQNMSDEFYKKIQGLSVPLVVKAIFKELNFDEGKYHMDLWAIPNVFKYKLDENATIKYEGETVQNVPTLTDIVARMKDSDINEYVAKRAEVKDTQKAADAYESKVEMTKLNSVVMADKKYKPSFFRKNYGIQTSLKDGGISYDPLEDRLFGSDKRLEYFTENDYHDGEYTYEDVMNNIAAAIDAQFFIIDTTVCFVSFNALMAMGSSEAITKSIQPRIEYWQMQEDSFELDINQYGFYNTVIVKHKNGEVKRAFDDLVRVYGEVSITYEHKDLDATAAQLKAQAYLAAHVRDFGMEVKATILHTGKICVSNFIKIQNPLTMSESLFYVYGTSIQWDASNQTIINDLDLRYGPENPDDPEVPEYGLGYTQSSGGGGTVFSGNVSANIQEAAMQLTQGATDPTTKGKLIYDWVDQNVAYEFYYESKYSSEEVLRIKRGNCWDQAHLIYKLCTAAGVKCEIYNGTFRFSSGSVYGHLWNKIEQNGKMVFADTGYGSTGSIKRNPIGSMHGGTILSSSLFAKNY